MELINRLPAAKYIKGQIPQVHLTSSRLLYINLPATRLTLLKDDSYIHFVYDKGKLYLYSDSEPIGFAVRRYKTSSGFLVYNHALVMKICDATGANIGAKFRVETTKREYDGQPLFELIKIKL